MSLCVCCLCFFKQTTAYELRISDWSSDVCSSDLIRDDVVHRLQPDGEAHHLRAGAGGGALRVVELAVSRRGGVQDQRAHVADVGEVRQQLAAIHHLHARGIARSEEHTSELQYFMRISYAVFLLKNNTKQEKKYDK